MEEFYFTFGGFNAPELHNYCVKIKAENEVEARLKMFKYFNSKWGFMYDEKPYEKEIDLEIAKHISNKYYKK